MQDHGNKDTTRVRKVPSRHDVERHGNHVRPTPSNDSETIAENERNKSFDTTHVHASTTSRRV